MRLVDPAHESLVTRSGSPLFEQKKTRGLRAMMASNCEKAFAESVTITGVTVDK